jgi:hypothetical protein
MHHAMAADNWRSCQPGHQGAPTNADAKTEADHD